MLHLNHLIITILINKELLLKNFCFCAHRAERALYVVSHYQLWCLAWFLSSPSAPLPTEKAISRVSHKLWDQSRKKLKEHYYFRGSADGLPHSNHAGQKMLIIPIFHFHFFPLSKPPIPAVTRLPRHPMIFLYPEMLSPPEPCFPDFLFSRIPMPLMVCLMLASTWTACCYLYWLFVDTELSLILR